MYKHLTRDKVDKIWSIFKETGRKNNRYPYLIRGITEIRKRIDLIPSLKIKQCPRHFENIRKYLLLNPSLYITNIHSCCHTLSFQKNRDFSLQSRSVYRMLIYLWNMLGCNEINFKSWYTKMPIEIENCRYLLGYK